MRPVTPSSSASGALPTLDGAKGIDDGKERLARLVRNTTRAYTRALQILLLPHQVTYGHWSLLRALWARDGVSQNELSTLSDLSPSTTSSAVKSLCSLGYVEQRKMPGNNKTIHVHLTREGRRLMRKLVPLAVHVNEVSVRNVSEEDVQTTRRVLLMITRTLNEEEQRAGEKRLRVPSTQHIKRKLLDATRRRATR